MEKLNLKLIKTSEYLQKFILKIRYKPEISNKILDILSRLININYIPKNDEGVFKIFIIDYYLLIII